MNLKALFKQKQERLKHALSKGGVIRGREWIDMGLSVKWATCNIGASCPSESGNYFAWGETEPKNEYTWDNYKFRMSGEYGTAVFSKYLAECVLKRGETIQDSKFSWGTIGFDVDTRLGQNGVIDGKICLEALDDAAHSCWGGAWRMPTKEEFDELVDRCSWELRIQKGKKGYTVTSKVNGNSIFLPLSGYWRGNHFGDGVGRYWTSSLRTEDPFDAYSIEFGYSPTFESDMIGWNSTSRSYGLTIRPVSDV